MKLAVVISLIFVAILIRLNLWTHRYKSDNPEVSHEVILGVQEWRHRHYGCRSGGCEFCLETP